MMYSREFADMNSGYFDAAVQGMTTEERTGFIHHLLGGLLGYVTPENFYAAAAAARADALRNRR